MVVGGQGEGDHTGSPLLGGDGGLVFVEVEGKYYVSEERLQEVSSAHATEKRKQKALRLAREAKNESDSEK